MHREMNSATTGWPRKANREATVVPGTIWPQMVLAKMRMMGTSRVAKERPALGSFSVSSRAVKSLFSRSLPDLILASILSRTSS